MFNSRPIVMLRFFKPFIHVSVTTAILRGMPTETISLLILVNNNLDARILEDTCPMGTRLQMMLV